MAKFNKIREKRAKKKIENSDLKKGLLDGQDDSSKDDAVYTDGTGLAIEMTSADSPPAARKAPPAAVSVSSASRQSSATRKREEVAIEIEQFPIPDSVNAKMGQFAPRYVCMGDGDAGDTRTFVQFLYDDFQKASGACQHLKEKLDIKGLRGRPNRVTTCSAIQANPYPTFARLGLHMVRIIVADYDREFGGSANRPQIKRTAFEAELNTAIPIASGQSAPAQSSVRRPAAPAQSSAGQSSSFWSESPSGDSGSSPDASGPLQKPGNTAKAAAAEELALRESARDATTGFDDGAEESCVIF